jgi:hypothetical protein
MLKKLALSALVVIAGLLSYAPAAMAQTIIGAYTVSACGGQTLSAGKPFPLTMDLTGNLCGSGGGGSSSTPFAPAGLYATLTATNASASVALPAGTSVVVTNTGTTAVSCKLTVGTGTAAASEDIVQPSSSVGFTVGSNTFENCIDQTGAASNLVVISGGAGIYAGAGGGSSGGGGETNYALETGGNLAQIVTNTAASVPAGSNIIGKVGIDQTTPGTTNGVFVTNAATGGGGGLANFQPNGSFTALPLATQNTSNQVAAPTGASVAIVNIGTTPAYVLQCTSSSCTAAATNIPIAPFSPYVLEMGSYTNIAAIDPTGTTNLILIGGSDLYQVANSPLPTGPNNIGTTGVAQGSTTSGQFINLMGCAATTAAPSYTTGQTDPCSLDLNGNLRVNVVTGAATGVAQGSTTAGQTGGLTQFAVTAGASSFTAGQTDPGTLTTAGALRSDLWSVNGTSAAFLMVPTSSAPATASNPALVVDLRPDSPGIIALGPAAPASSVPVVNAGFTYGHITTDTTTTLKSAAGVLHSICVNTVGAASTITVDDATSATTPTIAVLSGATLGCYTYDVAFTVGLTIVTATAAPDLTVSYR